MITKELKFSGTWIGSYMWTPNFLTILCSKCLGVVWKEDGLLTFFCLNTSIK